MVTATQFPSDVESTRERSGGFPERQEDLSMQARQPRGRTIIRKYGGQVSNLIDMPDKLTAAEACRCLSVGV